MLHETMKILNQSMDLMWIDVYRLILLFPTLYIGYPMFLPISLWKQSWDKKINLCNYLGTVI